MSLVTVGMDQECCGCIFLQPICSVMASFWSKKRFIQCWKELHLEGTVTALKGLLFSGEGLLARTSLVTFWQLPLRLYSMFQAFKKAPFCENKDLLLSRYLKQIQNGLFQKKSTPPDGWHFGKSRGRGGSRALEIQTGGGVKR